MHNLNTRWTGRRSPVTQEKAGPASKIFPCNPAPTQPSAPQLPAPLTTSENGQLIRKTIVSRLALQSMQMRFCEEGNYVRLPERINSRTLQRLRIRSQCLCKNSKLWWTDPPSGDRKTLVGQTLRKTIVSRGALQRMGISYVEDDDHFILSEKLDAATVRKLRDLSSWKLWGDPQAWGM